MGTDEETTTEVFAMKVELNDVQQIQAAFVVMANQFSSVIGSLAMTTAIGSLLASYLHLGLQAGVLDERKINVFIDAVRTAALTGEGQDVILDEERRH